MRGRALNRHHTERLKHSRKGYWGGYADHDCKTQSMVVNTPKPCSCIFCCNPHKRGELTRQELRADQL